MARQKRERCPGVDRRRTIGANVVLTDNGICSILYQGRSYNMEAVSFEGGRRYKVKCGYDSYDVRVIDAQARYQQARNGGGSQAGRQPERADAGQGGCA
ncbi:hypothetical protein [Alistipes indistinctus]|uniref:hypothetical protein n=1 Tax=Alistipes indistinctus TaxID=626932 RepID=UPI0035201D2B